MHNRQPARSFDGSAVGTGAERPPLFANLVGKLRHRPLQPRRGTRPRRARSRNLRSYYSLGTTFPGYRDAVGGPLHFDDAEILPALVPNGRGGDNELGLWTDHYHIASLTETPTEIVADVCDYRQRPTEVTKSSNAQVGFPWVVHLRNTTDTPPGLPGIPPDTDPDTSDPPRALRVPPDWNVFGRWQITKLHAGGRDWKGTAPEECTNWWLQRFPPGSNATDDGNVLVPAGTVVPGVPVAQQYPEWIGPSEPQ